MNKVIKIAFAGKAGSGKSTCAVYLVKKYGAAEYALATPLKEALCAMLPVDRKYFYDPLYKETPIPKLEVTGREIMQKVGTELFRNQLPKVIPNLFKNMPEPKASIWINNLLLRIQDKKSGIVVVSDCRFPDEYDLLKKNGFTVVHIDRYPVKRHRMSCCERCVSYFKKTHSSEIGLPKNPDDSFIFNNSDIQDLNYKVDRILGELSGKKTF